MAETSKPRMPCEQCGKTFSDRSNRNAHVKQVHSDERPFACTKGCDKRFKTKNNATTHERIDTLERPFLCEHCSKCFSDAGHLTRHMRSHSGEHPYVCEECGKAFTRSDHLTTHARFHSGEKPFACLHCSQRFTESGNLTAHLRTHTGERPYKCEFCNQRFAQSGTAITHERRKHAASTPPSSTRCRPPLRMGEWLLPRPCWPSRRSNGRPWFRSAPAAATTSNSLET